MAHKPNPHITGLGSHSQVGVDYQWTHFYFGFSVFLGFLATITSVDLMSAYTCSPMCSPRSSTASLVMIDVSLMGTSTSMTSFETMEPFSNSTILAGSMFLALSLYAA